MDGEYVAKCYLDRLVLRVDLQIIEILMWMHTGYVKNVVIGSRHEKNVG